MTRGKYLVISIVLMFIIVATLTVWCFYPKRIRQHHPIIAIYPSTVDGHDPCNNTEWFLEDLDLIKFLGFEGVRLHQEDFENYGYGRVADDLRDRGLKFVMVLHSWNDSQFPENESYVKDLIDYFRNIAEQIKYKGNLLWYALDYPFDWNNPDYVNVINSSKYKEQLQEIINEIYSVDKYHPIYLISGMIENRTVPPTDFDHVEGFGIMPYPQKIDDIEMDKIRNWTEIYRKTGKNVYIAEWGVRTKEGSNSSAPYDYGWASNESEKIRMIREFIDYIYNWDIYWDYFGLHDFPIEESDWGLAYDNNTLKLSGEFIRNKLS